MRPWLQPHSSKLVLGDIDDNTTMYRDTNVRDTGIVYGSILFSTMMPKVSRYFFYITHCY